MDELQDLTPVDVSALCAACHEVGQRGLPLVVIGAGLPHLPAVLSASKSYSERLFRYARIGRLDRASADAALQLPARDEGAEFTDGALEAMYALTGGYPYFVQAYGKTAWDYAPRSPITDADVALAAPDADTELAVGFFGSRFERATPAEREYLRAMADVFDGTESSEDDAVPTASVATVLGRPAQSLSPARDALLKKGLIYSGQRGRIAFTVPHFGRYLRQQSVMHCATSYPSEAVARHRVLADPGVHRDPGRDPGIDRAGRPELGDRADQARRRPGLVAEADRFLTEQQQRPAGQRDGLDRHRAGQIVDGDDGVAGLGGIARQLGRRVDVPDVLVSIGHHRPATIPSTAADDDHLGRLERVGRAHDRADVHVVLPVLDRDREVVAAGVEVGDDRLERPVPVAVDDVTAVAVLEQLRVEARVGRARAAGAVPRRRPAGPASRRPANPPRSSGPAKTAA